MAVKLATLRAKVGATVLDVVRPGWAKQINLDILSLGSCQSCVLGQLFGSYEVGASLLFGVADDSDAAASRAGFNLSGRGMRFNALTEAWRREVRRRVT